MASVRFGTPLVLAAAALALAACATPTPYRAAGPGAYGGYAEQRLESNRYRVTFSGNSVTSREQVEMSLLLRAAELTVQDGYDWFTTVNRATDRDSWFVGRPDALYRDRYWSSWGPSWRYHRAGAWSRWDPYWSDDLRQIDRYEASSEILMGRGPKPADNPDAFDARDVIANIGDRVIRP